MTYEVVYCSDCKKPIKSVPSWLAGVNVRFTCETCRQKHSRGTLGIDSSQSGRGLTAVDADSEEAVAEPELAADGVETPDDVDADAETEVGAVDGA